MKNVYSCPHCQSVLNPNVKILLTARCGKKRGMILLSPQPGNFKFIADPQFETAMTPGDKVTFACPVCSEELTSPTSKKLVELQLVQGDTRKRVEFSRFHGEQATFVINGDSVVTYGDDAPMYDSLNFFGV